MSTPRSGPKGAKGKRQQSAKEEEERLRALEEERAGQQRQRAQERAAEQAAREACLERDRAEARERRRVRREERAVVAGQRDAQVIALSLQLNDLNRSYAAERCSLEDRVQQLEVLREALEQGVAAAEQDAEQLRGELTSAAEEAARVQADLSAQLAAARGAAQAAAEALRTERTAAGRTEQQLRHHAATELSRHQRVEQRLGEDVRRLEREAERERSTAAALQEALLERERQEEHSIALLQLLRGQLDDAKQSAASERCALGAELRRLRALLEAAGERAKGQDQALAKALEERDAVAQGAARDAAAWGKQLEDMRREARAALSELGLLRARQQTELGDRQRAAGEAESAAASAGQQAAAAEARAAALEASLRERDRELFDRQVEMAGLLAEERRRRAAADESLARCRRELDEQEERRRRELSAAEAERTVLRHAALQSRRRGSEFAEGSDEARLKVTCFQLQSQLVQRERDHEALELDWARERTRLERALEAAKRDAALAELPATAARAGSAEAANELLTEQLRRVTSELHSERQARSEREQSLQAQIANLNQMFEAAAAQLRQSRDSDARALAEENTRLRALLDGGGNAARLS
eukprot:TRINITY_DN70445_c0_g1_i1.p1 TRINITY_DN70445_c0_g1~~TRINITY_DN70445_c0_g1_i1.p1  ORF type:complete len:629 (+),score=253.55 TRINITY_DN70445_c0_g1_i1:104-1888(+)